MISQLLDRAAQWARAGRPAAVLTVADQRRDRSPTICVKRGVATEQAVKANAPALRRAEISQLLVGYGLTNLAARLFRRPPSQVTIAVSTQAWREWRVRLGVAIVLMSMGVGFVVAGLVKVQADSVVLGTLVAVAGWALRVAAARSRWIGLQCRADRGEVIVTRVSDEFDAAAKRLYVASIGRRR